MNGWTEQVIGYICLYYVVKTNTSELLCGCPSWSTTDLFGLARNISSSLRLAEKQSTVRPNSIDMPRLRRSKKVRLDLGTNSKQRKWMTTRRAMHVSTSTSSLPWCISDRRSWGIWKRNILKTAKLKQKIFLKQWDWLFDVSSSIVKIECEPAIRPSLFSPKKNTGWSQVRLNV